MYMRICMIVFICFFSRYFEIESSMYMSHFFFYCVHIQCLTRTHRHVYVCIYIPACKQIDAHKSKYTCRFIHTHTRVQTCVYLSPHIHSHMHIHTHACVHDYVRAADAHIQTHEVSVCVSQCIHTHTYIYKVYCFRSRPRLT